MPRSSPQAVFQLAQRAMAAGDWETFFTCVRRSDLQSIARMLVPLVAVDPVAGAIAREHGVSGSALDLLRRALDDVSRSAATWPSATPADDMLERSNRHQQLVKAMEAAQAAAAKEVADLPSFVAALERHRRATEGGGTISSRLFVDEDLSDVRVVGSTATAVRRFSDGGEELVGFEQRRGVWTIGVLGLPRRR